KCLFFFAGLEGQMPAIVHKNRGKSRRPKISLYHRPTRNSREIKMCRNIKTLFNFEPPATDEEIHASALQFVRKLSGFNEPSQANAAAFERAVEQVSEAAR